MKSMDMARTVWIVAMVAIVVSSLCGCAARDQTTEGTGSELKGTVSLNGSTSMERVVGALAEAYMAKNRGVTVTYDATGSGTGIECATNGSCDIGLASRSLHDSETGLASTTVALDGIVVIANDACGVHDLSLDQVEKIFTGKITNWQEVGGANLPISCIGRESGSGTRDGFESLTNTAGACVLEQELTSTGAVITAVASSPNALGYASLSSVNGQDHVATLTINGIACSEASVHDGTYVLQRPFNFVVSESKQLSSEAQAFMDFATSAEAQELIRAAGAVPAA